MSFPSVAAKMQGLIDSVEKIVIVKGIHDFRSVDITCEVQIAQSDGEFFVSFKNFQKQHR